jgi:hypothetical protein
MEVKVTAEFLRARDELRRDLFRGIRITADASMVIQENEDHTRIYVYDIGEGKCRATLTDCDYEATFILHMMHAAEMKGAVKLTPDECQAEIDRYTPAWTTADDERRRSSS